MVIFEVRKMMRLAGWGLLVQNLEKKTKDEPNPMFMSRSISSFFLFYENISFRQ